MPRNKQKRKKDNGVRKLNPIALKIAPKKIIYFILVIAIVALIFFIFQKIAIFQDNGD